MSKSLDPNHVPGTGASQTVGVRLTPKLLDAVKVETERLRSMAPGTSFGLGDGVRSLLLRALSTDPAKAVNAAPVPAETPLAASPSMPPRRATQPPARASVRPPLPSVPPPPRVPAELVDDAPPASPQLALIPEPHAPTLSASKVRARLVAINATGVGVRAIGEAAGVSKSSVHNFLHGSDLTPDALDALARYVETHG